MLRAVARSVAMWCGLGRRCVSITSCAKLRALFPTDAFRWGRTRQENKFYDCSAAGGFARTWWCSSTCAQFHLRSECAASGSESNGLPVHSTRTESPIGATEQFFTSDGSLLSVAETIRLSRLDLDACQSLFEAWLRERHAYLTGRLGGGAEAHEGVLPSGDMSGMGDAEEVVGAYVDAHVEAASIAERRMDAHAMRQALRGLFVLTASLGLEDPLGLYGGGPRLLVKAVHSLRARGHFRIARVLSRNVNRTLSQKSVDSRLHKSVRQAHRGQPAEANGTVDQLRGLLANLLEKQQSCALDVGDLERFTMSWERVSGGQRSDTPHEAHAILVANEGNDIMRKRTGASHFACVVMTMLGIWSKPWTPSTNVFTE